MKLRNLKHCLYLGYTEEVWIDYFTTCNRCGKSSIHLKGLQIMWNLPGYYVEYVCDDCITPDELDTFNHCTYL